MNKREIAIVLIVIAILIAAAALLVRGSLPGPRPQTSNIPPYEPPAVPPAPDEIRNPFNPNLNLKKGNGTVYFNGQAIAGADADTVEFLNDTIFKDKNAVFAWDGNTFKPIPGLKGGKSLRMISRLGAAVIMANDTQVYIGQSPTQGIAHPDKLAGWNSDSGGENGFTDGEKFYVFTGDYLAPLPLDAPRLLENSSYLLGKNKVYYYTTPVTADPASFVLIPGNLTGFAREFSSGGVFYAKDANRVYFEGKEMSGADPASFQPFPAGYYQEYARDKAHVFYQGQIIDGADPATFKVLHVQPYEGCDNGRFAKDANAVYFEDRKVPGADPKTFQPLTSGYAKDAHESFWQDMELPIPPAELKPVCDYG